MAKVEYDTTFISSRVVVGTSSAMKKVIKRIKWRKTNSRRYK